MSLKFAKMSGFATTHGQDFEVNLAALLFLRGLNSDLDFQLGTNVKGAGAMDDLVFRFKRHQDTCWNTTYVQLKYKEKATVSRTFFTNPKGDFSLPKNFQSYREIKEFMSSAVKETLFDGSFDQCVFVIITNAKANDSLGEGRCDDLSLAEEFLWTDSGSVYSFEGDEDMLQCLGESGNDGRKFLSRLRVFCDQPNVEGLKTAVRDELYKVTEETVSGVDVARLCDAFLVNVKAWWEKSNDILHRGHDLLRQAVEQIRLESSCQKTLIEFKLDVEFKDQALSSLRQSLASDLKVFVLESSENSFRLSLTKLLQAVGGQALVLDSQGLLANRRALLAQWRSGDSKSLVICTEDWNSENAEECCQVVRDICQVRKASSLWNIVFCTGKKEVRKEIHKSFPECKNITGEQFMLSQLCKESRESVLAKKVAFQGCDVSLRQILCLPDENVDVDLDAYLDAPSVEQVLSSRGGLSVGSALAPGVDFYVDRSLGRATVVKPSLFHEGALRETVTVRVMRCEAATDRGLAARNVGKRLMVSDSNNKNGLVEKAIRYLSSLKDFRSMDLKSEEVIQNLNQSLLVLDKSGVFIGPKFSLGLFECYSVGLRFAQNNAVTALRVRTSKLVWREACFLFVSDKTNEQDVRKLSDFVQSKHLLSLENGQLRWLESHGDIESIRRYIDQDQVVRFAPETAMDVEDRLVLVCAEPGMGKSTLVTRLAQNTKAKHPHCFVVLIALNDHTQLFAEDRHNDALDFLSRASKIDSPVQRSLLKYALEVSGNVIVIFDGFDEIAPSYLEQCCFLLSSLYKNSKAHKIWMTSRNLIKQPLENHISKFAVKLLKFGKEDQSSFFAKFWAAKTILKMQSLYAFIDHLLESISQTFRDDQNSFLGIPLQTKMLAEVYEDYVTVSDECLKVPDKLDLYVLLEQFVEKKFRVYFQDKLKIPAQEMHHARNANFKRALIASQYFAALRALLDDKELKMLDIEWAVMAGSEFYKKILCNEDMTGFIDSTIDGKPRFVHRVFAEFLVAKWISEDIERSQKLIASKMFTEDFAVVRNIFDRILCRDSALHTAVLDEDLEAVRTLLGREDVDVQAQDGGGRTALHLAASRGTSEDREENKRRGEILDLLIGKTSDLDQVDNVLGVSPLSYADVTQSWNAIDKLLRCMKNKKQFNLSSVDIENQGMLDNIFKMDLDNVLEFCLNTGLAVETQTECESKFFIGASENGCLKVATLLLERNAETNKITNMNKTGTKIKTTSEIRREEGKLLFIEDVSKGNNKLDAANFINMRHENGNTGIHFAAKNGHKEVLSFLISQGGDPVIRNHDNSTPLHLAAFCKHPGAVRVLLEAVDDEDRAAAVNSCDKYGNSVLMCGARGGCVECVGLLVQAGGKLSQVGRDGETPLMAAARFGKQEVVKSMLHNFNAEIEGMGFQEFVNLKDKDGNTAMIYATRKGSVVCVELLVQAGAKLTQVGRDGETPLMTAAWEGKQEVVKSLLHNFNAEIEGMGLQHFVNLKDKDGNTAMIYATRMRSVVCVELLVQAGAKLTQVGRDGETPLMAAPRRGKQEVVKILHNFIANREGSSMVDFINMPDKNGRTALKHAKKTGQKNVFNFLYQLVDPDSSNQDNTLSLPLASETLRPIVKQEDGQPSSSGVDTAQSHFDQHGNVASPTEYFIELWGQEEDSKPGEDSTSGEDVELPKDLVADGTPLAAENEEGPKPVDQPVTSSPPEREEKPEEKPEDKSEEKPEDKPEEKPEGKSEDGVEKSLRFEEVRYRLWQRGASNGSSALHMAARDENVSVVKRLLDDDVDVNVFNDLGQTPLHLAVARDSKTRGGRSDAMAVVECLVGNGARFTPDRFGSFPLHVAAWKGDVEVVEYLLKVKPQTIDFVNHRGQTPVFVAACKNRLEVVKLLVAKGADLKDDKRGARLFHQAASKGCVEVVQYLLDEGKFGVDDEDVRGHTALYYALQYEQEEVEMLLIDEGATTDLNY